MPKGEELLDRGVQVLSMIEWISEASQNDREAWADFWVW